MPKIDKTVLKLIKTLKEFNMHKTKSNTKLKGGNFGNYSCISMTPIQCDSKNSIWKSKYLNSSIQLITKIITREDIFEKELAVAQYIDSRLAAKSQLLYALETCTLPSSDEHVAAVLQNCKNKGEMHNGKLTFDKNATTVYLLQIEHGGITLDNFIQSYDGTKTDDELYIIIHDILNNISELHSLNIAHNDINNPANITLKEVDSGLKAFLIDFGEAKLNASTLEKKKDIEDSFEIIKSISNLMQNTSFKNSIRRLKLQDTIDSLIRNLSQFYDEFQGISMSQADLEANLARLVQGQQVINNGTPVGTPQRTPVSSPEKRSSQMNDAQLTGKRLKF